jgi:hypothetical protein
MWMDKWNKNNNGLDFLKIKTGISLYRCLTVVISSLSIICSILFLINRQHLIYIVVSFLLGLSFLLLTIFMDKIVYICKLPTNYLLIYKDKIICVKNKKQIVFETNKISYEFHSFFEDFESLSQLKISEGDKIHFFLITKKQFESIEKFLKT